ncbi:alpha-amylase family glycosyl hydrolase, partial [Parvibaculum sp.]|uniref:alpha-amylase family glycosyl hydrolase n=1 Tax=Parvibaculum sp. TaxID=2024848 RepID=UPI002B98F109
MTAPRATARLQFHKGFRFADAVPVLGYYARLGVSHIYASPILKAKPGSMHGYDIVDHAEINPELGGEPAFRRFVAALRAANLGLIIDIVPNHMCVSDNANRWWNDVLEWGPDSAHAGFFDIDWHSKDASLRNKVHLPFLGKPYGEALKNGELSLHVAPDTGRLSVAYYDRLFPLNPRSHEGLTGDFATAFDAREPEGRANLHRLLERQHYRLAWWRTAADEINWRRFFDITDLAGLRVERPEVFEQTHALIFRLYAEGLIDGVRVDHVDGLADPRTYCRRLR